MRRLLALFAAALLALPVAAKDLPMAGSNPPPLDYKGTDEEWKEQSIAPPAYPKDADLVALQLGPTERNQFLVDASSISIGSDEIVRYILVIRTSGGALNVNYEGLRCKTGEHKIYAVTRSDGSWRVLPKAEWKPIENITMNRYKVALNREYFCIDGGLHSADEGRQALKLGHNPRIKNTN
ncbi:MAG TPA: CNP1-like family protein [Rhodocyclaceae bacterium]